jgi:hypothetical protein
MAVLWKLLARGARAVVRLRLRLGVTMLRADDLDRIKGFSRELISP